MASLDRRAQRHAALGDPVRLAIIDFLATSDRTVSEVREYLEISSSLLAHHLDVLENVDLIARTNSSADARKRFVAVRHENLPQQHSSLMPDDVLFVCTENVARSQLATALWKKLTGRQAQSAGTRPGSAIHPFVFEVGRQRGLRIPNVRPRAISAGATATIITVCDSAFEELGRSVRRLHWSIPDPVAIGTKRAFNVAIDELESRILQLKGATT